MTSLDVAFRYGKQPGPEEMRAIDALREVYGIRRVAFNEKEKTVRVEFDASRMKEDTVAALLRRAGIDLTEKLALA
jgi:copper chaperone CopZ